MKHNVYQEDVEWLINHHSLKALEGKTVLITGATGLIGRMVTDTLLSWNAKNRSSELIRVLALCRNRKKAEKLFGDGRKLKFVFGDVCNIKITEKIDYIIHTASMTSSQAFANEPVEIIETAYCGTKNMLQCAMDNNVKKFVYLSTMEIYGTPETDEKITETHNSSLDMAMPRSCYAESKRLCENMCICYQSEYKVPVSVIRLTQSFGPGVQYNDGRVFAQFSRCVIEGNSIILKTKGETKRSYLYVADAVSAIFTVMLNDTVGGIYNAANEATYCSVYDMAQLVAGIADNSIEVKMDLSEDPSKFGYAPTLHMNLDTKKLRDLGWIPHRDLKEMFERTILFMTEAKQ